MTLQWISFIVLHAVSMSFALFSLHHLYRYIGRYRFDESKYTLLFGFVHLQWIAAAYLVFAILWIGASFALFNFI